MKAKFVVGLGNPGAEYKHTRHNIGFEILDRFAEECRATGQAITESNSKKLYSKIFNLPDLKTFLVYPQTYMNASGKALRAVYDWYKLTDLSSILVVYDDVSLPLGQMRWVKSGGAGGQHGVESIIESFGGNKQFARLKFGIGPDPGGAKRSNFVLSTFNESEKPVLEKTLSLAVEGLKLYIQKTDFQEIMNRYNGLKIHNLT